MQTTLPTKSFLRGDDISCADLRVPTAQEVREAAIHQPFDMLSTWPHAARHSSSLQLDEQHDLFAVRENPAALERIVWLACARLGESPGRFVCFWGFCRRLLFPKVAQLLLSMSFFFG